MRASHRRLGVYASSSKNWRHSSTLRNSAELAQRLRATDFGIGLQVVDGFGDEFDRLDSISISRSAKPLALGMSLAHLGFGLGRLLFREHDGAAYVCRPCEQGPCSSSESGAGSFRIVAATILRVGLPCFCGASQRLSRWPCRYRGGSRRRPRLSNLVGVARGLVRN
jgi:hypothetical protein